MNVPEPIFMAPPPAGRRSDDEQWQPTRQALIDKTGQWAHIYTGEYTVAHRVTGRIRKSIGIWAGHKWQVTTRNTGSSSAVDVYAQHVGAIDPLGVGE